MTTAVKQSLLAWLAPLLCWVWTWFYLAIEWRLNPQYEYGFAVPFLAGLLLWTRLPEIKPENAVTAAEARNGLILSLLAIVPLFLGEFIRQADPFWRIGGWMLHIGATLLTLGCLLRTGGTVWFKGALPAVLFFTLAVPWPSFIEVPLTNRLLASATHIAVDGLNWLGIPALQRGNVIELTNGLVGIDEACSGIQSLLSSLMASVFLGLYLRLTWPRRILLIGAGVLMAVVGNVARIIILTKAVKQDGHAGFEKAHDQVGLIASVGIFLSLGLLAYLLRPRQQMAPPKDSKPAWPLFPAKLNWLITPVIVLLPLLVVLVWRGFAGSSPDILERPHWQIRANPGPSGWNVKADGFTQEEQRLLQFSEGGAWFFQRSLGVEAYVVHLFWSADRTIPSEAFGHSAQICLPSAGWKQIGNPSQLNVQVGTNSVIGTLGYFEQDGKQQAVFQATWRGSSLQPVNRTLAPSRWSRLESLKDSYNLRGHETLTVFIPAELASGDPLGVFSAFLDRILISNDQDAAPKPR